MSFSENCMEATRSCLIGTELFGGTGDSATKNEHRVAYLRAVFGELLVTYLFILCVVATGCNLSRAQITDPAAAGLATALVGTGLIYSFADVSGAHFNPAVTFGVIVRRKMSVLKGAFFMLAQFSGATFAILTLRAIPAFGSMDFVVRKWPDVTDWSVFIMEFLMSFNLVYVIFATAFQSTGGEKPRVMKMGDRSLVGQNLTIYTVAPESKTGFAPIAIGFTLGFLSFVGTTISSGAYNPARVFAGNIIGGGWRSSWVYYVAEFLGGAIGALTQAIFSNVHVFKKRQAVPTDDPDSLGGSLVDGDESKEGGVKMADRQIAV
jgi:aquaporin related protein